MKQIPAIYYPYCYATVGNVCEIAAINMPLDKKFRPNDKMRCLGNIADSVDINLCKLKDMVDREAWHAVVHVITKSQT